MLETASFFENSNFRLSKCSVQKSPNCPSLAEMTLPYHTHTIPQLAYHYTTVTHHHHSPPSPPSNSLGNNCHGFYAVDHIAYPFARQFRAGDKYKHSYLFITASSERFLDECAYFFLFFYLIFYILLVFRKKDLYLIITQKLTFMKSGGF